MLLIRMPNRPPIRNASATVADPGSGNAQSSTVRGLGGDAMAVTEYDADVETTAAIFDVIVVLTAARTRHCNSPRGRAGKVCICISQRQRSEDLTPK